MVPKQEVTQKTCPLCFQKSILWFRNYRFFRKLDPHTPTKSILLFRNRRSLKKICMYPPRKSITWFKELRIFIQNREEAKEQKVSQLVWKAMRSTLTSQRWHICISWRRTRGVSERDNFKGSKELKRLRANGHNLLSYVESKGVFAGYQRKILVGMNSSTSSICMYWIWFLIVIQY